MRRCRSDMLNPRLGDQGQEIRKVKARKSQCNAVAQVTSLHTGINMRVELEDLSVEDRRAIFSALLRDDDVVTKNHMTSENIDLMRAVDKACEWGTK